MQPDPGIGVPNLYMSAYWVAQGTREPGLSVRPPRPGEVTRDMRAEALAERWYFAAGYWIADMRGPPESQGDQDRATISGRPPGNSGATIRRTGRLADRVAPLDAGIPNPGG